MSLRVRAAEPEDAPAAIELAVASDLFDEADRRLVGRLLADSFAAEERIVLLAETDGSGGGEDPGVGNIAVGVADARPREATDGTWELVLIAVDQAAHGSGVGRTLIRRLERELAARRARLLLVETSDRPEFAPARDFYAALGFAEVARIPDVYADGDGMVVFARRLRGR